MASWSWPAAGTPSLEHVSPESLAKVTVDLVAHRFEKAQVRLELQVEGQPPKVACDPHLFEQVLVNLLLNGCDACSGGGTVRLSVRGDAKVVAFVVEDDGVGISRRPSATSLSPCTVPSRRAWALGSAWPSPRRSWPTTAARWSSALARVAAPRRASRCRWLGKESRHDRHQADPPRAGVASSSSTTIGRWGRPWPRSSAATATRRPTCARARRRCRCSSSRTTPLVTDLRMPEVDGLGLLAISRREVPERPVVVMTAFSAIDSAIESIRQGAYHYLTKPFKVEELGLFLERALGEARLRKEASDLRRELREVAPLPNVVGRSAAMAEACDLIARGGGVVDPGAAPW